MFTKLFLDATLSIGKRHEKKKYNKMLKYVKDNQEYFNNLCIDKIVYEYI